MQKRKRRKNKGDCLRRCVAIVLARPFSEVPDFVGKYRGRWIYYLAQWLKRRGYTMVLSFSSPKKPVIGSDGWDHIAIGTTRDGACHAIVLDPNSRIIYDGGHSLRYVTRILLILPIRAAVRVR